MRAVYCKCKNTYSIDCKGNEGCKTPEYWKQGIGRINAIKEDLLQQENSDLILQENNYKIII